MADIRLPDLTGWLRSPHGVLVPGPPPDRQAMSETGRSHWWSRLSIDAGLLLTVAGLFCYALARYPIDAYLGTFHVTSHDVGLSYEELVAPVAFVGAIAVGASALGQLIWTEIRKEAHRWYHWLVLRLSWLSAPTVRRAFGLLSNIALLIMSILIRYLIDVVDSRSGTAGTAGKILLGIWAIATFARVIGRFARDLVLLIRRQGALRRTLVQAFVGGFSLVVAFSVAHQYGRQEAALAEAGKPVELQLMGLTVPGIEARPAIVRTAAAAARSTSVTDGRCLVRLGEADGIVVFFDPRDKATLRISSVGIDMTDLPDGHGC